jgi:hypothetical protein
MTILASGGWKPPSLAGTDSCRYQRLMGQGLVMAPQVRIRG